MTGLGPLIEAQVDAAIAWERGLRGKHAPDTFLLAADMLNRPPSHCAVFEDALAGVEPAAPAGSDLWSASTATDVVKRCASVGPTSWSRNLRSFWGELNFPRLVVDNKAVFEPSAAGHRAPCTMW